MSLRPAITRAVRRPRERQPENDPRPALERVGIAALDSDRALNRLTRLASQVCGGAPSAIHVFTESAQRRIAAFGAPLCDHDRADSMCSKVVEWDKRTICSDASTDERFDYNSFTSGPDPVRFYASVPLHSTRGPRAVLGTLCAFDTSPRSISASAILLLDDLAKQAGNHLEVLYLADSLSGAGVSARLA